MRNHRLLGPLMAMVGAIAYFVVSLMTWYQVDLSKISVGAKFAAQYAKQADLATSANAWEPWGITSDLVMLVVIVGSIAIAIMLIVRGARSIGIAAGLLAIGAIGTLQVLLHILSGPQPTDLVDVQPIAWLGTLSTLLIMVGGYLSFDYAQHGTPQQPASPAAAPSKPAERREPSHQPSRRGVWDDADFE